MKEKIVNSIENDKGRGAIEKSFQNSKLDDEIGGNGQKKIKEELKEKRKKEIERMWWHLLVKISIYFLSIFIPIISALKGNYLDFFDITFIVPFVIAGYVLFSLFSIVYYQIFLYAFYKKSRDVFSYSFTPLIVITLLVVMSFFLIDFHFYAYNATDFFLHLVWNIIFYFVLLSFFSGIYFFTTANKKKAKKMILWVVTGFAISSLIIFLIIIF